MQVPPENESDRLASSLPATTPPAEDTGAAAPAPIEEGRRVDFGRGASWIAEGWRLFKEAPGSWVACFLIFIILMIVLAIIPLLGNIAGDFVKGPLHDEFEPLIRAGIREHRRIDEFTDTHPAVASFRRVLIPDYGHYSRAIADAWRPFSPA